MAWRARWRSEWRSVLDCGSPLPLFGGGQESLDKLVITSARRRGKAPGDWRSPKWPGVLDGPRGREASWTAAVLCRFSEGARKAWVNWSSRLPACVAKRQGTGAVQKWPG